MALVSSVGKEIYGKVLKFDDAYHQITYYEGNKENTSLRVTVYNNEEKQYVIDVKNFRFIPSVEDNSSNIYKQGYGYLKALSEYENAIDILEDGQK